MSKIITVEPVTRIEGHARITLELDESGAVSEGRLHVLEIRGFEKLLEGMELLKMPLITGRICGVCPAAHHLAAAIAIERGAGITIGPKAAQLRELLYLGHILHSHALSCFVLAGPDLLLGIDAPSADRSIFSLLSKAPEAAKMMLRLRSIGQKIVESIGGRGVHPVTVVPGGITYDPPSDELKKIADWGTESLHLIESLYPLIKGALEKISHLAECSRIDVPAVAQSNGGEVAFLDGTCAITSPGGIPVGAGTFSADRYADHLIEHVMPGSYMKSVRLKSTPEQSFFVGPLARACVNSSFRTPRATTLLTAFKGDAALRKFSALDNIEARLIEMVYCAEMIENLARNVPPGATLQKNINIGAGRYVGIVEAPRGILIHDYTANAEGIVTKVNMIVATQNNYHAINAAITGFARSFIGQQDEAVLFNGVEFALRCFDPCLACATHVFGRMPMELELRQNGTVCATLSRKGAV